MIFSVVSGEDSAVWNYGCTIERLSDITSSDISGLMMDGSYFNDVIGTFLRYSVRIEVPFGRESEFNHLYEILNKPVEGHTFTLPYGGGTIDLWGRISNVKDIYVRMKGGKTHWKGITFEITGNHPTKFVADESDEAVLMRGAPPLPPESDVNVGEAYIYGSDGWEVLGDAEDNYY